MIRPAARVALPVLVACPHLGARVPGEPCGSPLLRCDLHGDITTRLAPCVGAQRCCQTCDDHPARKPLVGVGPVWDRRAPLRFDHTNLFPHLPGKRFNAGLIADRDGYVFAWRDGWAGSNIWLCRLDRELRPVGAPVRPDLSHPAANYGREDPQLFRFRGRLHMAFVGVCGGQWLNRADQTHVLYAEVYDDLTAGPVFHPKAPGTHPHRWEKNWEWFDHDGELHAVYSISPHRVLRVDGDRAEWVAETPYPHHWAGGEQRGGASPVRVGDEWWCFFHDSIGARKLYRMGLYAFEAKPPFRVTRFVPYPVSAANIEQSHDNYCDVWFPRGTVRAGCDWLVSGGCHDRFAEIRAFRHDDLEKQLVTA